MAKGKRNNKKSNGNKSNSTTVEEATENNKVKVTSTTEDRNTMSTSAITAKSSELRENRSVNTYTRTHKPFGHVLNDIVYEEQEEFNESLTEEQKRGRENGEERSGMKPGFGGSLRTSSDQKTPYADFYDLQKQQEQGHGLSHSHLTDSHQAIGSGGNSIQESVSRLSIQTNQDEFVLVHGRPPSGVIFPDDGRVSVRSHRSLASRMSLKSDSNPDEWQGATSRQSLSSNGQGDDGDYYSRMRRSGQRQYQPNHFGPGGDGDQRNVHIPLNSTASSMGLSISGTNEVHSGSAVSIPYSNTGQSFDGRRRSRVSTSSYVDENGPIDEEVIPTMYSSELNINDLNGPSDYQRFAYENRARSHLGVNANVYGSESENEVNIPRANSRVSSRTMSEGNGRSQSTSTLDYDTNDNCGKEEISIPMNNESSHGNANQLPIPKIVIESYVESKPHHQSEVTVSTSHQGSRPQSRQSTKGIVDGLGMVNNSRPHSRISTLGGAPASYNAPDSCDGQTSAYRHSHNPDYGDSHLSGLGEVVQEEDLSMGPDDISADVIASQINSRPQSRISINSHGYSVRGDGAIVPRDWSRSHDAASWGVTVDVNGQCEPVQPSAPVFGLEIRVPRSDERKPPEVAPIHTTRRSLPVSSGWPGTNVSIRRSRRSLNGHSHIPDVAHLAPSVEDLCSSSGMELLKGSSANVDLLMRRSRSVSRSSRGSHHSINNPSNDIVNIALFAPSVEQLSKMNEHAKTQLSPQSYGQRSRSASTCSRASSRRGEGVAFSTMPELYSHPDDKFGNNMSGGEPFRPTSEHQKTPVLHKHVSRRDSHKTSPDADSLSLNRSRSLSTCKEESDNNAPTSRSRSASSQREKDSCDGKEHAQSSLSVQTGRNVFNYPVPRARSITSVNGSTHNISSVLPPIPAPRSRTGSTLSISQESSKPAVVNVPITVFKTPTNTNPHPIPVFVTDVRTPIDTNGVDAFGATPKSSRVDQLRKFPGSSVFDDSPGFNQTHFRREEWEQRKMPKFPKLVDESFHRQNNVESTEATVAEVHIPSTSWIQSENEELLCERKEMRPLFTEENKAQKSVSVECNPSHIAQFGTPKGEKNRLDSAMLRSKSATTPTWRREHFVSSVSSQNSQESESEQDKNNDHDTVVDHVLHEASAICQPKSMVISMSNLEEPPNERVCTQARQILAPSPTMSHMKDTRPRFIPPPPNRCAVPVMTERERKQQREMEKKKQEYYDAMRNQYNASPQRNADRYGPPHSQQREEGRGRVFSLTDSGTKPPQPSAHSPQGHSQSSGYVTSSVVSTQQQNATVYEEHHVQYREICEEGENDWRHEAANRRLSQQFDGQPINRDERVSERNRQQSGKENGEQRRIEVPIKVVDSMTQEEATHIRQQAIEECKPNGVVPKSVISPVRHRHITQVVRVPEKQVILDDDQPDSGRPWLNKPIYTDSDVKMVNSNEERQPVTQVVYRTSVPITVSPNHKSMMEEQPVKMRAQQPIRPMAVSLTEDKPIEERWKKEEREKKERDEERRRYSQYSVGTRVIDNDRTSNVIASGRVYDPLSTVDTEVSPSSMTTGRSAATRDPSDHTTSTMSVATAKSEKTNYTGSTIRRALPQRGHIKQLAAAFEQMKQEDNLTNQHESVYSWHQNKQPPSDIYSNNSSIHHHSIHTRRDEQQPTVTVWTSRNGYGSSLRRHESEPDLSRNEDVLDVHNHTKDDSFIVEEHRDANVNMEYGRPYRPVHTGTVYGNPPVYSSIGKENHDQLNTGEGLSSAYVDIPSNNKERRISTSSQRYSPVYSTLQKNTSRSQNVPVQHRPLHTSDHVTSEVRIPSDNTQKTVRSEADHYTGQYISSRDVPLSAPPPPPTISPPSPPQEHQCSFIPPSTHDNSLLHTLYGYNGSISAQDQRFVRDYNYHGGRYGMGIDQNHHGYHHGNHGTDGGQRHVVDTRCSTLQSIASKQTHQYEGEIDQMFKFVEAEPTTIGSMDAVSNLSGHSFLFNTPTKQYPMIPAMQSHHINRVSVINKPFLSPVVEELTQDRSRTVSHHSSSVNSPRGTLNGSRTPMSIRRDVCNHGSPSLDLPNRTFVYPSTIQHDTDTHLHEHDDGHSGVHHHGIQDFGLREDELYSGGYAVIKERKEDRPEADRYSHGDGRPQQHQINVQVERGEEMRQTGQRETLSHSLSGYREMSHRQQSRQGHNSSQIHPTMTSIQPHQTSSPSRTSSPFRSSPSANQSRVAGLSSDHPARFSPATSVYGTPGYRLAAYHSPTDGTNIVRYEREVRSSHLMNSELTDPLRSAPYPERDMCDSPRTKQDKVKRKMSQIINIFSGKDKGAGGDKDRKSVKSGETQTGRVREAAMRFMQLSKKEDGERGGVQKRSRTPEADRTGALSTIDRERGFNVSMKGSKTPAPIRRNYGIPLATSTPFNRPTPVMGLRDRERNGTAHHLKTAYDLEIVTGSPGTMRVVDGGQKGGGRFAALYASPHFNGRGGQVGLPTMSEMVDEDEKMYQNEMTMNMEKRREVILGGGGMIDRQCVDRGDDNQNGGDEMFDASSIRAEDTRMGNAGAGDGISLVDLGLKTSGTFEGDTNPLTSTPRNTLVNDTKQGRRPLPGWDDSFVSTITTHSQMVDHQAEFRRQISRLEHQLEIQQKQIDMTEKVLFLARKKHKTLHELTAQRTLLVARERVGALRSDIQRMQAMSAVRRPPPPVAKDMRGTMHISNITVHLNRNFCSRSSDLHASYAFIVLLKCGVEVEATAPVSLVDSHLKRIRQLHFAENVRFGNLPVDFAVHLEIYAMRMRDPKTDPDPSCAGGLATKARLLLTPRSGRKNIGVSTSEPVFQPPGEFVKCGRIVLNRDTVGNQRFYVDNAEYPLEGTIEINTRCTTLPAAVEVDFRGFLTMYQVVAGLGSWVRFWAVLRRGIIHFWKYPDDEVLDKAPMALMDLSKCMDSHINGAPPDISARPNSFSVDMLVNTAPTLIERKRVLLSADTRDLCHAWLECLNETLGVIRGNQ